MATRRPTLDGPSRSSTGQPKTWGEVLKEHRERAGLTQAELADMVVTHQTTISHLESGRTAPTRKWAKLLDEALGSGGHLLTAFELVSPYLSAPHPNWDWLCDMKVAVNERNELVRS
ncbi:transcriptional regulator with XRE-family HTH domain [Kitasatospora sp. MAA4]|uniref:helix-turn-helix domain-containing protein n=1 Tax=Kitasatospora sp. MAA4 TaxID=3035093 RepID=UPI002476F8E8|nr:helix-turn-helix transcriptional regulator [Kitasatospora sp. MAA4]MDH6135990.1 transcriptional regulator with XRE-family HTH domain [Kitasatospora sp. MAA4]